MDESVGLWDLLIRAGYSPWQTESIRIDAQTFPQERSTLQLLVALGTRESSQLVKAEGGWRGEWGFYAGPALVHLERRIRGENRETTASPDASVLLPGAGAGSDFTLLQDQTGFALGIHAQYDMYWNAHQIEKVGRLITQGSISASVGVGW
jgi:hypothetical protein